MASLYVCSDNSRVSFFALGVLQAAVTSEEKCVGNPITKNCKWAAFQNCKDLLGEQDSVVLFLLSLAYYVNIVWPKELFLCLFTVCVCFVLLWRTLPQSVGYFELFWRIILKNSLRVTSLVFSMTLWNVNCRCVFLSEGVLISCRYLMHWYCLVEQCLPFISQIYRKHWCSCGRLDWNTMVWRSSCASFPMSCVQTLYLFPKCCYWCPLFCFN